MQHDQNREQAIQGFEKAQPRFGSYIGLAFILAMIGILSFAVFHDSGVTQAFNELKPGMTTTQVAALLGVPRTEAKSGARTVQTWEIPDGHTIVVEFQDGKLKMKDRKAREAPRP
jgi:hypothetical protein